MLRYLRITVFALYFVLIAMLGVLICLCRPFNPSNNRIIAQLFSSGGLRILGIKVIIENGDRLENLDPSVIVSNHQSNLDLYIVGCLVPARTASIGKSSLKWIPFFGQLYWLAGNVLIDRKNAKQSIDAMSQASDAIVEGERTIWVFPEGTRSQGRGLGKFKKGAFHIAIKAQCAIHPVAASTYPGTLDFSKRCSGVVRLSVLAPVETNGLSSDDAADLCHKVHLMVAEEIERLDGLN